MHKTDDQLAQILWDYMQLGQKLHTCDAIFVLCSLDTRGSQRAAELYHAGLGDYVIFSGGFGRITGGKFARPEADIFADIAMQHGVPRDKIIIENQASNTGANIQFTYQLLQQKDLHPRSFILVQKPYMERRTYATFKKQWPDANTEILVTSPRLSFDEYCTPAFPKNYVTNIMVGDLQRIKEYPRLGYQIEQVIPAEVWRAYEELVKRGYDKQLMSQS